jgi:uncharacterized protein (DUF1697 family)
LIAVGELGSAVGLRWLDPHDGHLGSPASAVSPDVGARMDDEPVEPGIEPLDVAQHRQIPPGPYQRVLCGVLREVGVAEDQASDRVQPIDGANGQDAEGLVVSASRPIDESRLHASFPSGATDLVAYTLRRCTMPIGSINRTLPSAGADAVARYLVLLRGVNVGGKNSVPMGRLRELLEELGYSDVGTYIASGNVMLRSDRSPTQVKREIEAALPKTFRLDSELIAVRVLTRAQLRAVVKNKPRGFGEQPDMYHSDTIFLIGIDAETAMKVFDPHPEVDRVWPGNGVIYSQRLSAKRTKSRLNKAITTPLYKSMTIRSWATTTKLLDLMESAGR